MSSEIKWATYHYNTSATFASMVQSFIKEKYGIHANWRQKQVYFRHALVAVYRMKAFHHE